jgi:hypothetical protein
LGRRHRGEFVVVDPTLVVVTNSDGSETRFGGTGLAFAGGVWSGTVESAKRTDAGGATVFEQVGGFSEPASDVIPAATDADPTTNFLVVALAGNDDLTGWSEPDDLRGFQGEDTLDGQGGRDTLFGGGGPDILLGRAGDDSLFGQDGDDVLGGGPGGDVLDGGAGSRDRANYAGAGTAVRASLADPSQNTNDPFGDEYVSIEGLIGSAFNDALFGDGGHNLLRGGEGEDFLHGGDGVDEAEYVNAAGVTVDLLDPGANTGEAEGDTLVSIEGLQGSDFADILRGDDTDNLTHSGSNILEGRVVTWEMEDGTFVGNHNLAAASTNWQIVGTGDLDADGDDDLVWRHQDGRVVTWETQDGELVRNHNLAGASTSWQIVGTNDFDADGDDDLLWHHQDGRVVTWEMQDGGLVQNHNVAVASTTWEIVGTQDFDTDGDADILWRNADGTVLLRTDNFGTVSNAWQVRGTGEFDLA